MKYIIYLAVAALVCWSVWYVVRQVRRQVRGQGCCGGDCARCGHGSCSRTDKRCPCGRAGKRHSRQAVTRRPAGRQKK